MHWEKKEIQISSTHKKNAEEEQEHIDCFFWLIDYARFENNKIKKKEKKTNFVVVLIR
jgi:hypothetical protein